MHKLLWKIILSGLSLLLLVVASIAFCNWWAISTTKGQVFSTINELPKQNVGLVLGTNPLVRKRYINPYFTTRIDAAAVALYKQGKVKHLIVSGDNGTHSYDEPTAMRDSLIKKGIPESAITLDYAGFRTLDSVVRCKEVFQQNEITIISQEFHNHRAVMIANHFGIQATAFNANKPFPTVRTKPEYREYLARCKAMLDLYILNKQPKFLGKKIEIKF